VSYDDEQMERCVYCGEERSPDQFEDGLRCKLCQEADEQEPLTEGPIGVAGFLSGRYS
jgi:hypothetical protein